MLPAPAHIGHVYTVLKDSRPALDRSELIPDVRADFMHGVTGQYKISSTHAGTWQKLISSMSYT
jgi:hypothetical protein